MQYSIYKDSKVETTLKKIKKIIKSVDIEVEEHVHQYPFKKYKPSSLTLTLFGTHQLSNGKGTTLANARASAYSEFMERLQNNCLSFLTFDFDNFIFAPDEKPCKTVPELFYNYYSNDYIDYVSKILKNFNRFYQIPFYNVRKKEITEIPIELFDSITGTNGLCAGNTPQEALVQGLAEVYERYSRKQVILNEILMPDIPENIWKKYDRITELKTYLKKYGYDVYFKDASLGKNLPVVCTVFDNKSEGFYSFNFGAQPSLPIAIERSLTEFMQGGVPPLRHNNGEPVIDVNITDFTDRTYIYDSGNFCTCPILKKEKIGLAFYNQLFTNNPDYNFSLETWVDENKKYTNSELLKFSTNTEFMKDKDIFIRDVSFLNFPSYCIYVPGVSEIFDDNINEIKGQYYINIWNSYKNEIDNTQHNNIDDLIYALEFKINKQDFLTENITISPIPNEYLLVLCYIVKNDIKNIIKNCEKLLDNKNAKIYYKRTEFIYDYFKLKNEYSEKKIQTQLEKKYKSDYIKNLTSFISELNFDKIKHRISVSNNQKLKKQKTNINDTYYHVRQKDYGDIDLRIANIRKMLAQKYVENTPNQMKLKNVFDFV